MATQLRCYACGELADLPAARCGCGEPLWFDTDPTGFTYPDGKPWSMWRYDDLLPVAEPDGVMAAAGGTPLVRTPGLDGYAGCRVHLKDEAENPTGSFKDRGSAVGCTWAIEAGYDAVGTVSHGNMAMSMAANAAGVNLDCVVLVPADIPPARLTFIAQYDPTIVRVEGDYGRLYYEALDIGAEAGVPFINSDVPLRVAGQKTVALEICEAMAPSVPDAIVLPVSSGGHASGVWKALRELQMAGRIDTIPRLYCVQAAAVDPIATAYRNEADRVAAVADADTIAYSIANPDPPSGNRILAGVRATDGAAISVSDAAMAEAMDVPAADAGFSSEAASAAALAGLRQLTDAGEIGSTEDVVAITTGTGFKEGADVDVETEMATVSGLREQLPALF
ncbi:MAG: pyridoxal-phosphate dependent enzyme [Halobacteriales archaeon]